MHFFTRSGTSAIWKSPSRTAWSLLAAVAVGSTVLVACNSDDEDGSDVCDSTVMLSSLASPSSGVVTVNGEVAANESVLLRYTRSGVTNTASGTQTGSTIRFSGLPQGQLSVQFFFSCEASTNGKEAGPSGTVTVM